MTVPIVCLAPDQSKVELGRSDETMALDVAFRITASPHEWTWSHSEQALMARYCLWAHQRLAAIKQIADGPLGRPSC